MSSFVHKQLYAKRQKKQHHEHSIIKNTKTNIMNYSSYLASIAFDVHYSLGDQSKTTIINSRFRTTYIQYKEKKIKRVKLGENALAS